MQNWLCGELLSLRKRWKWPLGFNTMLISCICPEQEHLASQGLCYFPLNRKLPFYYSELRAEIWADVAAMAPPAPAVFPLRSAFSQGYTNILPSYPRLGHALCKLLTAPCKRQSCPRSFGEVGKGWEPRWEGMEPRQAEQGHGGPTVGCEVALGHPSACCCCWRFWELTHTQ